MRLISKILFSKLNKSIKPISDTEKIAIESGDTWFESSIFEGKLNWNMFDNCKLAKLSKKEQSFINTKLRELLLELDDWDINNNYLSKKAWGIIQKYKFLGLLIPTKYGGLGFSQAAHSQIIRIISAKSMAAAVTIMVPNSLGPGELILRYGTASQKKYLKDLADGKEIPCFGLTGPRTGSDATSMPDSGIVCYKNIKGKKTLGLSLTFEKRYITLAPIATLIGLAIDIKDPDKLLGKNKNIGISLCLVSADQPGVKIGKRHKPLNVNFMNGPIYGKDVFVPMDAVIGGKDNLGHGWKMLTECLAEGRGISLPSLSSASSAISYLTTSSYSLVRKQFKLSIMDFSGAGAQVAKTAGLAYLVEALREFTLIPITAGKKPSVVTAMAKYFSTELARDALQSAMDIHGGKAIIDGPNNYLARLYDAAPIGITVEGANLLTKHMIIFGQGVMRCHPNLGKLFQSILKDDLKQFDKLLSKQVRSFCKKSFKAYFSCLGFSGLGKINKNKNIKNYQKHIDKMSLRLSILVDIALIKYGPKIKQQERISGRFADIWGHLFLACAVIKYFKASGGQSQEEVLLHWCVSYCLYKAQEAMFELFANMDSKLLSFMRRVLFPWGRVYKYPSDKLDQALLNDIRVDNSFRSRLKDNLGIDKARFNLLSELEDAFVLHQKLEPVWGKLKASFKSGKLEYNINPNILKDIALKAGVIDSTDAKLWSEYIKLSDKIIGVDVF